MITRTRAALAVAACAALVASLTACASSAKSDDYPSNARSNFVASCEIQPGATTAMCERCLEAVEKAIPYDEFVRIDTAIRMGTASRADTDRLANVIENCA